VNSTLPQVPARPPIHSLIVLTASGPIHKRLALSAARLWFAARLMTFLNVW